MTHSELVQAGVKYLTLRGFFVWPNNTGMKSKVAYGKKGSGDVIGMFPNGRFISIEAKIGKDTQKEDQVKFQADCEKRNAIYILYHDIPELQQKLIPYMKNGGR